MTELSMLDREVLGWLLDDYESPSSLASDISREVGSPTSEAEVAASLARLTSLGLATAYLYDASASAYRPISSSTVPANVQPWYFATNAGRAVVEASDG